MLTQLWENPIFVRARQVEARRQGKGLQAFVTRFGGGMALVLGPLAVTMFFTAGELLVNPEKWVYTWLGSVVGFTAFLGILYLTMRAVSATAGAISLEKEQKTYECLLATRLRSDEVLAGKLAAHLWPITRELMAAAPIALGLGILSGHALQSVLFVCLAVTCVSLFGLLGTWASYTSISSQQASRKAMFLALGFVLMGPMVDFLLYGLIGPSTGYVPLATLSSPMVAAWSVLSLSNPAPMQAWQWAWAWTFVLYGVLCLILWWSIRRKAEEARVA